MKSFAKVMLLVVIGAGVAWATDALPQADSPMPGMINVATLQNGFSIRFDHRRIIDSTSRLFMTSAEDGYVDIPTSQITAIEQEKLPPPPPAPQPPPATIDVHTVIASASDKHDLDSDLITSVVSAESGFHAEAVSPKGAQGLMQLMPETAAKLGVRNAFDPQANVEGGTRYLRELLARYNNDLAKALAAYNAGPHRVEQYRGIPPYHETRAYVRRIIRDFNRKKLAAEKQRRTASKPPASHHASAVGSGS